MNPQVGTVIPSSSLWFSLRRPLISHSGVVILGFLRGSLLVAPSMPHPLPCARIFLYVALHTGFFWIGLNTSRMPSSALEPPHVAMSSPSITRSVPCQLPKLTGRRTAVMHPTSKALKLASVSATPRNDNPVRYDPTIQPTSARIGMSAIILLYFRCSYEVTYTSHILSSLLQHQDRTGRPQTCLACSPPTSFQGETGYQRGIVPENNFIRRSHLHAPEITLHRNE